MPTKLPRVYVSFPPELYAMVKKDSEISRRSESNQVIWILDQYYSERRREADLFATQKLREARGPGGPVFETPDQLPTERVSKLRVSGDQEKK